MIKLQNFSTRINEPAGYQPVADALKQQGFLTLNIEVTADNREFLQRIIHRVIGLMTEPTITPLDNYSADEETK